jgi:deoxyribonuclease V
MKLAVDVAYNGDTIAQAVGVCFDEWLDLSPKKVVKEFVMGLEPYQPGEFYKRELPCILRILSKINISTIDTVIIDGYVYLDDTGKPGLGAHLYSHLLEKIPVIGVAKTAFANNTFHVREIYRGESERPLYISAIGVDVESAATLIKNMAGQYRMPTLLNRLDQLTRK